jgi:PRP38 family.
MRALAALYIRMTFRAVDVYELLEPLLKDYRKLRVRNMGTDDFASFPIFMFLIMFTSAGYSLTFMDEFVNSLLTEERICDLIMPRLIKRQVLEENGDIGPRKSRLLDALDGQSDHGNESSGRSISPDST